MTDRDDDETGLLVRLYGGNARRWADLLRRARVQGGCHDDEAATELVLVWAQAEAARRSRD